MSTLHLRFIAADIILLSNVGGGQRESAKARDLLSRFCCWLWLLPAEASQLTWNTKSLRSCEYTPFGRVNIESEGQGERDLLWYYSLGVIQAVRVIGCEVVTVASSSGRE